eukprot:3548008-Pyramimonas_sp.AAC.1
MRVCVSAYIEEETSSVRLSMRVSCFGAGPPFPLVALPATPLRAPRAGGAGSSADPRTPRGPPNA